MPTDGGTAGLRRLEADSDLVPAHGGAETKSTKAFAGCNVVMDLGGLDAARVLGKEEMAPDGANLKAVALTLGLWT